MNKKFDMTRHGVIENAEARAKSNLVNMVFNPEEIYENEESRVKFEEIDVNRIKPRSINQYKQNRIDRLAKSIRNTNNRLIHPIVVAKASDLPADGDVMKRFAEKGVEIKPTDYIIVAGERRYRAWLKLREEENQRNGSQIGATNRFDTITANVLTKRESKAEEAFFEDSNLESRQLTPVEAILHIKDALDEVKTPEEKRQALIDMAEGNAEKLQQIPEDPEAAAAKFVQYEYCKYYLSAELGIEGWGDSTIRTFLSVINNCTEEVVDAIIDGTISAGAVRKYPSLNKDVQNTLINLKKSGDEEEYKLKYNEAVKSVSEQKAAAKKEKKVVKPGQKALYSDYRKKLEKLKERLIKDRSDFEAIADDLETEEKKAVNSFLRKMDIFIIDVEKSEKLFQE